MNVADNRWQIVPAATETGEPFSVTFHYTDTVTGVTSVETDRFATETEAVHCMGDAELYTNWEPISHSDNIDRSKYRY